ncbi:MAG: hypothetical protein MPW16_10740 [Candidatus Manganitrophus sp.]|nr:MAG: hypothetical protein MPW16_10740 [Candidatus Manganitrophus sp.]
MFENRYLYRKINPPLFGPTVWAQERSGLPDVLKGIPLPERERRVVDNIMLWTREMFESSTKALEGVSEEIERQDGSGERRRKRRRVRSRRRRRTRR